jgi:hypothetical protein
VNASDLGRAKAHRPRLVRSRDVHAQIHGGSRFGRFNAALAVAITKTVGTMWMAYLFAALALISFPAAIASHDVLVIVSWIAQTFLQLVLLPIILVGQNVISAGQDARAEADHETLTALHTINVRELQILERQEKILEMLERERGR